MFRRLRCGAWRVRQVLVLACGVLTTGALSNRAAASSRRPRVVVTGMGVVSPIGNSVRQVLHPLRFGIPGIVRNTRRYSSNIECKAIGSIRGLGPAELKRRIPRDILRTAGEAARYAYVAAGEAIAHAALSDEAMKRAGAFIGQGGTDADVIADSVDRLRKGSKQSPVAVPQCMDNSSVAAVKLGFDLQGPTSSLTAACATGAHNIIAAAQQIQLGQAEVMLAGGAEQVGRQGPIIAAQFGGMRALSTKHPPKTSSRPWDRDRDGFVPAGGAGVLVLESREHALGRGAPILAELVGYGWDSDPDAHISKPNREGPAKCVTSALEMSGRRYPDYINAHGTSTPAGDINELHAIALALGEERARSTPISSTKSITGHTLGAAGAIEAIFSILAMRGGFVPPTTTIQTLDPEAEGFNIVRKPTEHPIDVVLSNSFGFGGTNGVLLFARHTD